MSAHAGAFHRDGASSYAQELDVCLPFLDRLGPEGGGAHVAGSVSFAHRIYRVTPESFEERSPHIDGRGFITTWDGRIDNREDLALQLHETPPANLSDAAYAHAAFARWGADAFSRLLGEWAIGAWNPYCRELFLARDFTGASPLFYYLTPSLLLWSSELEAVVAMAREQGLPLNIDEGWIAGFLGRGPDLVETPYREIRAVEPGFVLRVGASSQSSRRHTFLDTRTRICYRSDAGYEEHFRFLFRQAVNCRLRCVGKVFSHLSGGLDSSSVSAMAAHIVRGSGSFEALETLSSVYNDTPASDESEYIGLMEERLGLPTHRISESDYPALTLPDLGYEPASPSCIDIFAVSQRAVRKAMEQSGARVQLSGEGGDELLGNTIDGVPQIRDLIQGGPWREIPRVMLRWSLAARRTQWRVAADVLLSMLPDALAARLDTTAPMRQAGYVLAPAFVRRSCFWNRLHVDIDPFDCNVFSQRTRSIGVASVVHKISACAWRRIGPMGQAYPIMDRRLVTFLLAIPIDQLARAGSPRSLQRRAMRDLLPPKLLMRRSKRSPDAAVYRRVTEKWNSIESVFQFPLVVEYGIADPQRLAEALQQVRRGSFPVTLVMGLRQIELWLRSLAGDSQVHACAPSAQILRGKEVNWT